jgi:hypothetical protein
MGSKLASQISNNNLRVRELFFWRASHIHCLHSYSFSLPIDLNDEIVLSLKEGNYTDGQNIFSASESYIQNISAVPKCLQILLQYLAGFFSAQ